MSDSPTFRRRSGRGAGRPPGGYVPVDEEYLQQSGIRGGRSWCLCALIIFLLLVAVLNVLVTVGLVYFLSITHEGMAAVEFFPGTSYTRILKSNVHADEVKVHRGVVGKPDRTLTVSGEQDVVVGKPGDTHMLLHGNTTVITSRDFEFKTPSNKFLLSSNQPFNFAHYQVINLHASQVDVGAVTSRKGVEDLHIESYNHVNMVGTEGVTVDAGGDVTIKTERDISLMSLGGSVTVQGDDGIYLSPDLPMERSGTQKRADAGQHQLCVCVPSGKVFAVPVNDQSLGCQSVKPDSYLCVN